MDWSNCPFWMVKVRIKLRNAAKKSLARFGYYPDDEYHHLRRVIRQELQAVLGKDANEAHEWLMYQVKYRDSLIQEGRDKNMELRKLMEEE